MSEIEKIQVNLHKLPKEIIYLILFYSLNIQPISLLRDIRNISNTKALLNSIYSNYWEEEDKDWLINDIFAYSNNHTATMYGYVPQFYNIFLRNISLNNTDDVNKYLRILQQKSVTSQINIFLGLYTNEERVKFTWQALLDYH
jgi:hypothetical protein